MKKLLLTLALAATLFASASSVQNLPQLSDTAAPKLELAFFDGNPTNGGSYLTTVTPVGTLVTARIADIETAEYVVVTNGTESYTLHVFPGGENIFTVLINTGDVAPEHAMSLADFIAALNSTL